MTDENNDTDDKATEKSAGDKAWYLSKTLWAGLATICTGLGLYFSGEQQLQELVIVVIGVVFSVLRLVTKVEVKK